MACSVSNLIAVSSPFCGSSPRNRVIHRTSHLAFLEQLIGGTVAGVADQSNAFVIKRSERPLELSKSLTSNRNFARLIAQQLSANPVDGCSVLARKKKPDLQRLRRQ